MIEKILERLESSYHVNFNFHIRDDYRKIIDGIYDEVFKIVQEVTKEYGWIPCSERLPEENCEVLIAREKNKYEINMGYRTKDFWYDQCYHHIVSDVIAWMPLPAPYQKGE